MNSVKTLYVFYHGRKVGTLAVHDHFLAAFQYDREWLSEGFSISPFSLPLQDKVFLPKPYPNEGLFGVFSDSLPDGWGRLLVDRLLLRNHIDPYETGSLNRLSIVGSTGMGALTYQPEDRLFGEEERLEYDEIAAACRKILNEEETDDLDELFRLGGSSGGARPKILTRIEGEPWIVKFPSASDSADIGRQEYDYSLCAKECGIEMTETRLFPSRQCEGYFGTKRFDCTGQGEETDRIHMISAAGLLETSHRIPNLDYDQLMKMTLILTRDFSELKKLYRLMCFNVFAHNRDDHSKNFSYLYIEEEERWTLSPAYDLTYSASLGGEHATMVHGNGRNPGRADLLAVADQIGLSRRWAAETADEIRECVRERLGRYLESSKGG